VIQPLGEKVLSTGNVALPETGELVICTVTRVFPYGAYATLDEYNNAEGLIHISEISSSWVKNIREHVREGQKTVLKVLRVDDAKLHVDLSLRRISDKERKEKLLQWKQENRGKRLLGFAAEKMQVTSDEAYEKVGKLIEDKFENIYLGLEKAVESGEEALIKCGVPPNWAGVLMEIAQAKIKLPRVKIRGILEITTTKPEGVTILKNVFTKARGLKKPDGSDVKIFTLGAPRYRIEVTAGNYKDAEDLLERAVQMSLKSIKAEGGEGKFIRGLSEKA